MTRLFFIWLFLTIALTARAQKTAEDYFNEAGGDEMFWDGDSTAIHNYMYLVEQYPTSKYCSTAHYRIGTFYEKKGQNRLAINAYRASFFDGFSRPSTEGDHYSEWDARPNAMAHLADLYEKAGNYDSALYFLYMRDTGIIVVISCGTGEDIVALFRAVHYSDLHLKINEVRRAETVLLPYAGTWIPDFQAYDTTAASRLTKLFKEYENPDTLKNQMEAAISNYYFDTSYYRSRNDTFISCCFNFLGTKLCSSYRALPGPMETAFFNSKVPPANLPERQRIIAIIKNSNLYDLIQKL